AFGAQQFIGDVCRRVANESAGRDANRGGFRRRLLGKGLAAAEETRPQATERVLRKLRLWSACMTPPLAELTADPLARRNSVEGFAPPSQHSTSWSESGPCTAEKAPRSFPSWVRSVELVRFATFPLYPNKPT